MKSLSIAARLTPVQVKPPLLAAAERMNPKPIPAFFAGQAGIYAAQKLQPKPPVPPERPEGPSDEQWAVTLDNWHKYQQAYKAAANGGLGSLTDADLNNEAATLQSLQLKQQLGGQSLSLVNQRPQTLLNLFT